MKETEKRAVISVSDKDGVVELAQGLVELGYRLVSTGGTAATLERAGVQVERVEQVTGFPELLGGRVKTLHPKIHAGILARDLPGDLEQLQQLGINPISLVVVNLYPFRETVARPETTLAEAVEQIDIGGPTMVRAAAKNFARVTVVVNPKRYPWLLRQLREKGGLDLADRFELAREAFWHTAVYDAAVAAYLYGLELQGQEPDKVRGNAASRFPSRLMLPLVKLADLRYGENPHQQAAFYREDTARPCGVAGARQHHGKELSFNNILDLDAALRVVSGFQQPAAVVIKHNTPAGVACAGDLATAFRRAHQADALAAYGGIIGLNRQVDGATAAAIAETFFEAVVAPGYSQEALEILTQKKNLRLLSTGQLNGRSGELGLKRVSGGFLLQDLDEGTFSLEQLRRESRVVTQRAPSEAEWQDLGFAWKVVKHVFSNGIVLAREGATVGVGGGQVSRVDAAWIALRKAGDKAKGAVLASDGFMPFSDSIEQAAAAGVTAVIQPGGSIRDEEVIAAADRAGLAMVFTGRRHFKH